MRGWELLLVTFIYLRILGRVFSQDSGGFNPGAFVNNLEQQVQAIAAKAVENYGNADDLVKICQSQDCSRAECHPIKSKIDDIHCVLISNTTFCSNTTTAINANYGRGYVRTPPNAIDLKSYLISDLSTARTICTQRELDSTFMEVSDNITNSSDPTQFATPFVNVFFGAVDGTFRYFPGREILEENCNTYDPRIRPWFTGATSVVKDLVVLLDTGSYMQQTLTACDRATLIPFNENGTFETTTVLHPPGPDMIPPATNLQFVVPECPGSNQMQPAFGVDFLGSLLNATQFSGAGAYNAAQSSDLTAGLTEAFATLGDPGSPADALKIVILITSLQDNSTAQQLFQQAGSFLFVYDFGDQQNPDTVCETVAYYEQICTSSVMTNSFLSLSSYFTFLANSRSNAHKGIVPFWQTIYTAASGIGMVITVSYPGIVVDVDALPRPCSFNCNAARSNCKAVFIVPAIIMSDDGPQLIGVAAIDIPTNGLIQLNFGTAIDNELQTNKRDFLSISKYAAGATINCSAGNNGSYQHSCSNNSVYLGNIPALCNAPRAKAAELEKALCQCAMSSSTKLGLWIGVGVATVLVLFGLISTVLLCSTNLRFRKNLANQDSCGSLRVLSFIEYSYEEISLATDGFDESENRVLGRGAFGVVFRAILRDTKVAVKWLKQHADRADGFEAELKILGIARHQNLVELKGFCFQPTECFLVYELVECGDLESWLWPKEGEPGEDDSENRPRFLSWNKRRKIARGTARALTYLHEGLPNGKIFHLDIKPANILLEQDCNPKIADFGISQLYEPGYTLKTVKLGTLGYCAPELFHGKTKPNSKIDVYSYGMVLLELLSGRRMNDAQTKPSLLQWARDQVEDGRAARVLDERIFEGVQGQWKETLKDNGKRMVSLAVRCLSDDPDSRPEMSEVVDMIEGLNPVFELGQVLYSDVNESENPEEPLQKTNSTSNTFSIESCER